jgi:hypothetical protein
LAEREIIANAFVHNVVESTKSRISVAKLQIIFEPTKRTKEKTCNNFTTPAGQYRKPD